MDRIRRTLIGALFRQDHDEKTPTPPPPDGGFRAWLQVAMGHLVVFNTWGYINSFGIFQQYYSEKLNRPPADISWIGSLQILLVYFIGTFSGRAIDAGYYRPVLASGLILQILGVFMTSFSNQYWQLILAQGVCQGLGNGLLFCPTIALLSTYFAKKRTVAISCAACGAATGGMVFPAMAKQLLGPIGFPWTVRCMGFVVLANAVFIFAFARTRIPPRKTGPFFELEAFKELSYVLFAAGTFLCFMSVYFAYYYVGIHLRICVFVRR
jgi:MFS family permease